ncbi:Uncharacterised protein [Vibrio cholerae]|nr:Uncharacterised protein [Vibrio cholerae]CSI72258.1 Uncharacterised protein [Vibrio cholerae]
MIRPRVLVPTGTEIGAPVFCTVIPRRKPSELPITIARITPPPSCC